ncbi:nitrate- and nitrite sensing domain-containing protein [Streptomyces sp. NPDC002586]
MLREQDLVRELQRERGLTNGLLNGAVRYRDDVRRQRMRTDAARASLRAALSDGNGDLPAAAAAALIDAGGAGAPDGDRRVAQGVQALQALARATEAVALERGSLNGVFAARRFRSGEYLDFTEVRAARVAALGQFRQLASGAEQSALDRAFATAAARRVTGYEAKAGAGADGSTLDVDPARWWADMTTLVDDLHGVRKQVGDDVRARADQVGGAATRELAGFLALGALILAVASALAVFSARSLTRPLGALADEADAVAGTRLPDAVRYIQEADPDTPPPAEPEAAEVPGTAREISRPTAALRKAERTAVGFAVEQVVLRRNSIESLAGLGRRNQALLSRRLGLITTLESQELDPDALAELFELDHLATCMRRNAESMLVLAGEESPARRWPGTVTVSEVVQSAVSEAEQYQRVAVTDLEQCRVRGHCVAEFSHLLAELVENALLFSPPRRPVTVHGRGTAASTAWPWSTGASG